jgi:pectin methylesterase-like acyl-CoA thioesterase/lysophospholipase L1-like esterase
LLKQWSLIAVLCFLVIASAACMQSSEKPAHEADQDAGHTSPGNNAGNENQQNPENQRDQENSKNETNEAPEHGKPEEKYDIVVAKDGSGDFTSVQEAIKAVPIRSEKPTRIFIKKGVYKEKVVITRLHPNLHFIGEDRDETVITYDDYSGMPGNPDNREIPTVYIMADDFHAENITFENSAGTIAQALALFLDGDRAIFRNVRFLGWQDTLRVEGANKRSYFKDCYIEGHVDYIYGSGMAVFDNCTIFSKKAGYITASSAPKEAKYGLVFVNSRLTGSADPGTVYLGRPWRDYAAVAFIGSTMDAVIHPAGWHNWDQPAREQTSRYAEYGNNGPGGEASKRVPWTKQLTEVEAEEYMIDKVLAGNDGWNPSRKTHIFIAGDSTASNYDAEFAPRAGWGQVLQPFFTDDVVVKNYNASGRSSKSFIEEGRLEKFADEMKENDVLIIQFGHNDEKSEDPKRYTIPDTTYKEYLTQYIEEARKRGAIPVLATSVNRNSWDGNGKLKPTHGKYPEAMIELAKEKNVPLIDITEKSRVLFEELGPEGTEGIFLILKPGESSNYPDGVTDNTHFQEAGAKEIAKLVIVGLKENQLEIARMIASP